MITAISRSFSDEIIPKHQNGFKQNERSVPASRFCHGYLKIDIDINNKKRYN